MMWNKNDENGMYSTMGKITASIFPTKMAIFNRSKIKEERLKKMRKKLEEVEAKRKEERTKKLIKSEIDKQQANSKKKINEDDFYFLNMNGKGSRNGKNRNTRDLGHYRKSEAPDVGKYRPKYDLVKQKVTASCYLGPSKQKVRKMLIEKVKKEGGKLSDVKKMKYEFKDRGLDKYFLTRGVGYNDSQEYDDCVMPSESYHSRSINVGRSRSRGAEQSLAFSNNARDHSNSIVKSDSGVGQEENNHQMNSPKRKETEEKSKSIVKKSWIVSEDRNPARSRVKGYVDLQRQQSRRNMYNMTTRGSYSTKRKQRSDFKIRRVTTDANEFDPPTMLIEDENSVFSRRSYHAQRRPMRKVKGVSFDKQTYRKSNIFQNSKNIKIEVEYNPSFALTKPKVSNVPNFGKSLPRYQKKKFQSKYTVSNTLDFDEDSRARGGGKHIPSFRNMIGRKKHRYNGGRLDVLPHFDKKFEESESIEDFKPLNYIRAHRVLRADVEDIMRETMKRITQKGTRSNFRPKD